jgi:hypothetical protein
VANLPHVAGVGGGFGGLYAARALAGLITGPWKGRR